MPVTWERRQDTYQADAGGGLRLGAGRSPMGGGWFWSVFSFRRQRNIAGGEATSLKQAKRFAETMLKAMVNP